MRRCVPTRPSAGHRSAASAVRLDILSFHSRLLNPLAVTCAPVLCREHEHRCCWPFSGFRSSSCVRDVGPGNAALAFSFVFGAAVLPLPLPYRILPTRYKPPRCSVRGRFVKASGLVSPLACCSHPSASRPLLTRARLPLRAVTLEFPLHQPLLPGQAALPAQPLAELWSP